MKTHIIKDGVIVNTILATVDEAAKAYSHAECIDATAGGWIGDAWDGIQFASPAPTPEQQQIAQQSAIKRYDGIVQDHIDAVAQSFGYGDPNRPTVSAILHAISYADEPEVLKFQAEGRLLRAWRSRVWATAATILKQYQDGQRTAPTESELLAELPAAPTINDLPPELR